MMCYAARVVALAATMLLAATTTHVQAFAPSAPLRPMSARTTAGRTTGLRMVYVPDGLTLEQWKKIKAKEEAQKKDADLGRVGVKGFESRSLQAWQEAGARHLFPVNPKKVNTIVIPCRTCRRVLLCCIFVSSCVEEQHVTISGEIIWRRFSA